MTKFTMTVVTVILLMASPALADDVLILSSGSATFDNQMRSVLEAHNHNAKIGAPYHSFFGAGLEDQDVVLLLANYNWDVGDMPLVGQDALVDFVANGGGLITAEWTVWKWATQGTGSFVNSFVRLGGLFPIYHVRTFGENLMLTYTAAMPDPVLNANLPPSFTFQADEFEGTESFLFPLPTATVFYGSRGSQYFRLCGNAGSLNPSVCFLEASGTLYGAGLVGWRVGAGHVLQFSTLMGPKELADPTYSRLVANAVTWAGHENLGPLVSELRFEPGTLRVGESVSATFVGHQLTDGTYFDLRYRVPEGADEVVFNWQQGTSAAHRTSTDTLIGFWEVTGIRAHQNRDDHSGDFDPVFARLVVAP